MRHLLPEMRRCNSGPKMPVWVCHRQGSASLGYDEEKVGPRANLVVDSAELVRVLELSISTGCFSYIANAQGHGVMCDNAFPILRTDAD